MATRRITTSMSCPKPIRSGTYRSRRRLRPSPLSSPSRKSGIVVMCNIHPWMRVYANVLSNPYYAITGADGSFTIKGLPPGTYTLEAWHEKFGAQEKKVKVGSKSDFTFTE